MEIRYYVTRDMGENSYLLYDLEQKKGLLLDPGGVFPELDLFLEEEGIQVESILLSHGHYDHWGGAEYYRRKFGPKIYAPAKEEDLLRDPDLNYSLALAGEEKRLEADGFFQEGDLVSFLSLQVLETPGHSPGSACFLGPGLLFSGDTLFREGVGRWDLPGGGLHALLASVARLLALPGELDIYPGHGPKTELSYERLHNPMVPYLARLHERKSQ